MYKTRDFEGRQHDHFLLRDRGLALGFTDQVGQLVREDEDVVDFMVNFRADHHLAVSAGYSYIRADRDRRGVLSVHEGIADIELVGFSTVTHGVLRGRAWIEATIDVELPPETLDLLDHACEFQHLGQ